MAFGLSSAEEQRTGDLCYSVLGSPAATCGWPASACGRFIYSSCHSTDNVSKHNHECHEKIQRKKKKMKK